MDIGNGLITWHKTLNYMFKMAKGQILCCTYLPHQNKNKVIRFVVYLDNLICASDFNLPVCIRLLVRGFEMNYRHHINVLLVVLQAPR